MSNSKTLKIVLTIRNIILVNFLWVLFSIPVITAGASTCAAFYLTYKLLEDSETPLWKNFIKGFKSSFVQGTVMWIFTVLASVCLYFIWTTVLESGFSLMTIGAVICTLVIVMFFIYAFPLIARYNNTLKNILRNSAGMSFTYWVRTLCIVLLAAVLYAVFSWNIWMTTAAVCFVPGLFIYVVSILVKGMFTQMELHQKSVEAEETESDSE